MPTEQVKPASQAATWALALAVVSGSLAAAQNKLLWGYWFTRPSLASELRGAEHVFGVSALVFAGTPHVSQDRTVLETARRRCRPVSNECLEGRLLLALDPHAAAAADVRDDLLQQAWSRHVSRLPLPRAAARGYEASAHPTAGIALNFRRGGRDYVALAYRTSEIANDRYVYSEVLYRLETDRLDDVRMERYFYEIAGIEGLDWRVLWALDLVGLAFLVGLAAWLRKWTHNLRRGSARRLRA